jgi:hypothetical protein
MGKLRNAYKILVDENEERDNLKDESVDGRILK